MLNPDDMRRYSRQPLLPDFWYIRAGKLRAAAVLVIGAGGLGSRYSSISRLQGVGQLGVVDQMMWWTFKPSTPGALLPPKLASPRPLQAGRLRLMNPLVDALEFPIRFDISQCIWSCSRAV